MPATRHGTWRRRDPEHLVPYASGGDLHRGPYAQCVDGSRHTGQMDAYQSLHDDAKGNVAATVPLVWPNAGLEARDEYGHIPLMVDGYWNDCDAARAMFDVGINIKAIEK